MKDLGIYFIIILSVFLLQAHDATSQDRSSLGNYNAIDFNCSIGQSVYGSNASLSGELTTWTNRLVLTSGRQETTLTASQTFELNTAAGLKTIYAWMVLSVIPPNKSGRQGLCSSNILLLDFSAPNPNKTLSAGYFYAPTLKTGTSSQCVPIPLVKGAAFAQGAQGVSVSEDVQVHLSCEFTPVIQSMKK